MKDKNILITGANGGLGQAFVKEILSLNPKKIYCAARDINNLNDINNLSSSIEVLELDITNNDSIKKAVAKIDALDILINNAGVNTNCRLFDSSFLDIEVNLKGTMNLTEALFAKLKDSKGKVVNVSSILALLNLPVMANYCVSKSALHSFTQALRAEFNLFGGEVFEVLPGPIDTKMTEGFPMKKAQPADIAKFVLKSLAKKEFEIFPDQFSQMVSKRLKDEPKKILNEFTMSIQA